MDKKPDKKKSILIGVTLVILLGLIAFCISHFVGKTYTISFSVGEHGTVNDKRGEFSEEYSTAEGPYKVKYVPDEGYMVDNIIINGEEDPGLVTIAQQQGYFEDEMYLIEEDATIEVSFKEFDPGSVPPENIIEDESYTVTTSAGKGGSITDSFEYTEDDDDYEYEVVIASDPGYYIDTVKINGEYKTKADNVGIGEEQGVYTFREGDQTVEATFTKTSYLDSKAGIISLEPDKTEIKKNEKLKYVIVLEPKNTQDKSNYYIDISDYEFISCDKGKPEGTVIAGTIDPGVEKEVVNLTVRYSNGTLDGTVTATLQNGIYTSVNDSYVFLISDEDAAYPEEEDMSLYEEHSEDPDSTEYADPDGPDISDTGLIYIIGIAGPLAAIAIAVLFGRKRRKKKDKDKEQQ